MSYEAMILPNCWRSRWQSRAMPIPIKRNSTGAPIEAARSILARLEQRGYHLAHERSAGDPLDCDCVELKAKLHLAVAALRKFEALVKEIIDGKGAVRR